ATSVTANWAAFGVGPGNNTSEGYELDAATDAGFASIVASSISTSVTPSTLSVIGLTPFTTYYLRVGGINYNNVRNFTTIGSTQTLSGGAVTSPAITQVYVSSLTVTWTDPAQTTTGYDVEASTMNNFTGTIITTATTNITASTLTFNLGQLAANTTYFVRVGALYSGSTVYANTVPSSTSTLTSLITVDQIYQVFSRSVTANWPAFGVAPGNSTSEGYELDAATDAGFASIVASSISTSVTPSTLTVIGLTPYTTYYLRVGGINYNNVRNFTTIGSTQTLSGGAVTSPAITQVYVSSLTVTWTDPAQTTTGFDVEASTMNNFTGTIITTATTNITASTLTFNLGQLAANTTYFVRVGTLYSGSTVYANTVPQSTSTLTSLITVDQIYQVFATSVTANWVAFGVGPGNNTSEGYELDAATDAGFASIVASSISTSVTPSTLTVIGLTPYTTYYLRVGGINYNNVRNFTTIGSTQTLSGGAVTSPAITQVYVSSLTVTWTDPAQTTTGYDVEASTMNNFTGTIITTATTNITASTLTFNLGQLAANTTYFVRVGALYSGSTVYANTVPQSTSTWTSLITVDQIYQVFATSVTANWATFGVGPGNNTSEGYELDAATDAGFASIVASSISTSVTPSTLTVIGLTPFTTYYLRVGGINYNNARNYTVISATQTMSGGAVTSPAITQ